MIKSFVTEKSWRHPHKVVKVPCLEEKEQKMGREKCKLTRNYSKLICTQAAVFRQIILVVNLRTNVHVKYEVTCLSKSSHFADLYSL